MASFSIRSQTQERYKYLSSKPLVVDKETELILRQMHGDDMSQVRNLLRGKRSIVWEYFLPTAARTISLCRICKAPVKAKGNTMNLFQHLEVHHPLQFASLQLKHIQRTQTLRQNDQGRFILPFTRDKRPPRQPVPRPRLSIDQQGVLCLNDCSGVPTQHIVTLLPSANSSAPSPSPNSASRADLFDMNAIYTPVQLAPSAIYGSQAGFASAAPLESDPNADLKDSGDYNYASSVGPDSSASSARPVDFKQEVPSELNSAAGFESAAPTSADALTAQSVEAEPTDNMMIAASQGDASALVGAEDEAEDYVLRRAFMTRKHIAPRMKISIAEIRRRMTPPESLAVAALAEMLRFSTKKDTGEPLKALLEKHSLWTTRRKSGLRSSFTRFCEHEMDELAANFEEDFVHFFPFDDAERIITEQLAGLDSNTALMLLNKYLEILDLAQTNEFQEHLQSSEYGLASHTLGPQLYSYHVNLFRQLIEHTISNLSAMIAQAAADSVPAAPEDMYAEAGGLHMGAPAAPYLEESPVRPHTMRGGRSGRGRSRRTRQPTRTASSLAATAPGLGTIIPMAPMDNGDVAMGLGEPGQHMFAFLDQVHAETGVSNSSLAGIGDEMAMMATGDPNMQQQLAALGAMGFAQMGGIGMMEREPGEMDDVGGQPGGGGPLSDADIYEGAYGALGGLSGAYSLDMSSVVGLPLHLTTPIDPPPPPPPPPPPLPHRAAYDSSSSMSGVHSATARQLMLPPGLNLLGDSVHQPLGSAQASQSTSPLPSHFPLSRFN